MKTNTKFILPEEWDKPEFFKYLYPSYITKMGSHAYGVATKDSDYDFYSFIIPPSGVLFPHTLGHIQGFGKAYTPFEQYQIQHAEHPEYGEIDLTVYNIVKYFQLTMSGNPNLIDSLFTLENEVLYSDRIGDMVKENRHLFLSEKMFHTFKGMAYSHASRLRSGHTKDGRKALEHEYGYDTKDAYHAIRIMLQIKSILQTGDMNLKENAGFLIDIRNGCFTLNNILATFDNLMSELEAFVADGKSVVPYAPDEKKIKQLLVNCLEEKYGSLGKYGYKE